MPENGRDRSRPHLEAFFTERLANHKRANTHTVGAYRDTFRLLLGFARDRTGKTPSNLDFDDVDAVLVGAFLDHLEHERHNSVRTRNARLAAIHSMFRYAALAHPEHAALIARVLAIPTKRFERTDVSFLDHDEIDALLAAPDRTRWVGRRDHALLVTAVQTGLRVSELVELCCADVNLDKGAHVQCTGKGRKQREAIVGNLNRVLRGWAAFFRCGNSSRKFEDIDRYVHERLAILASRKHGKPGWNLGRFNWEWLGNLRVYRLRGKTRWRTAHAWR